MPTGGGILSSNHHSQFTPSPVPTDTTTSTMTLTTSPASVSAQQWEQHYKLWVPAPQVPGPPFDVVRHDWPCLPPTTVLSLPTTPVPGATTPARDATMSALDTTWEIVLPVPLTTQEETFALAVDKRLPGDAISNFAHLGPCIYPPTADGKACSKCQWVQSQRQTTRNPQHNLNLKLTY